MSEFKIEYRGRTPWYTVTDRWGLVIVSTRDYRIANNYRLLAQKGHTARTLWIWTRGPAAIYRAFQDSKRG